jgi:hypothetical protein
VIDERARVKLRSQHSFVASLVNRRPRSLAPPSPRSIQVTQPTSTLAKYIDRDDYSDSAATELRLSNLADTRVNGM